MKRGFTLLELVVVIIVLGILASFAIPQFINATEKARAGEALGLMPILAQGQIRYATEFGTYSQTLNLLDVEIPATPKYFTIDLTNTATPGLDTDGAGNETVATLTRNTQNRPGNRGAYAIGVCENGRIWCTNGGTFNDCIAIGQGEILNQTCPAMG